ncbi:leucine-rich repeat protein 1 isoform X3 [Bicyclus anynana]|uniref:Leucine-rich repeat protein 1 isoform X3 n=1 Tax=Bicyclus anynana TaxID=110368 RepID=A0ABM3LU79_BICAN|nr:leucine-rich repeat protein 1 isoform X3 [Bicyclus anynana]
MASWNTGNLPSLRELYLSNNSLGLNKNPNWQWLLGIQVSKTLKVLDLCGNKLEDLPKSIWKLQNLITLKLDNNILNKLPSSLGRISTLRYLSVSKNNLQYIPYSLKHCGLEHLDISLNDFTPEETGLQQYGTQWEFYNSLVHIAAKAVLENKLSYAPNILPKTLVELLDNSNICICGKPVLDDKCLIKKTRFNEFSSISFILVKDFFTVQCFICSPKCHYYFRVIRIYNLILNT